MNLLIKKIQFYLRIRSIQISIVLFLASACYFNTLGNSFAWDDREFLTSWPQIKSSENGLPAYLSLPYLLMGDLPESHKGVFRPVRSIFYLTSYNLYGENALGYHIQALIIHVLIVLVIYLLVEVMTKKIIAFITAAFFATHPVHTEAISFITASFDTIGILFFFLAFYHYLKSQQVRTKKNIYLFSSLLYSCIAFFTYEMTLILPALIVLYDFCTNNYSFHKLTQKRNIYQYFLLILTSYGLVRFLIFGIGDRGVLGENFIIVTNQARVGMAEILFKYIYLLFWPTNMSISQTSPGILLDKFLWTLFYLDRSENLIKLSSHIVIIFPIIYITLSILISFFAFKKYPLIFFSIVWFFLSLLPASNIFPQGAILAIRFLYIPSFGFALFFALIFHSVISFHNKRSSSFYSYSKYITILLMISVLFLYSYFTVRRNLDWRDEKVFWESTIRDSPWDVRSYRALAKVYFRESNYNEAENYFQKALTINPSSSQTNSDIGVLYATKQDFNTAISYQKKAVKFDPNNYQAYIYLGDNYLHLSKYNEAEEQFKNSLIIMPNNPLSLKRLGDIYFKQHNYQEALKYYQLINDMNPSSGEIKYQLGLTYTNLSKYKEAEESFISALEIDPKRSEIYMNFVNILIKQGKKQKAIQILKYGITKTDNLNLKNILKQIEIE